MSIIGVFFLFSYSIANMVYRERYDDNFVQIS